MLELVAKLQKVDDLHMVLPLFLSGGAFAVYQGLSEDVKEDYADVRNALTATFSASPLTAYEEFVNRRLKENESVDVYLAEQEFKKRLREAACLCASGFPQKSKSPTLCVWVNGKKIKALLDTGCSKSILNYEIANVGKVGPAKERVIMMNGNSIAVNHKVVADVTVNGITIGLGCLVADIVPGYQMLLGIDVVRLLGVVQVSMDGHTKKFNVEEINVGATAAPYQPTDEICLPVSEKITDKTS